MHFFLWRCSMMPVRWRRGKKPRGNETREAFKLCCTPEICFSGCIWWSIDAPLLNPFHLILCSSSTRHLYFYSFILMYSLLFVLVPLAIVKYKPPSASSLLLYQLLSQRAGPALAHLTPRYFDLSTRPVTVCPLCPYSNTWSYFLIVSLLDPSCGPLSPR